jgi:hypothetical protein
MARARAGQAAAEAFGKVGTVKVPRDAGSNGAARDTPEAPPVPQGPAQPRAAANQPKPVSVPDRPVLSKALRQHLEHGVVAAFGKAAAADEAASAAREVLARVVADARRDGLDEDTIIAAARKRHMEPPPLP